MPSAGSRRTLAAIEGVALARGRGAAPSGPTSRSGSRGRRASLRRRRRYAAPASSGWTSWAPQAIAVPAQRVACDVDRRERRQHEQVAIVRALAGAGPAAANQRSGLARRQVHLPARPDQRPAHALGCRRERATASSTARMHRPASGGGPIRMPLDRATDRDRSRRAPPTSTIEAMWSAVIPPPTIGSVGREGDRRVVTAQPSSTAAVARLVERPRRPWACCVRTASAPARRAEAAKRRRGHTAPVGAP